MKQEGQGLRRMPPRTWRPQSRAFGSTTPADDRLPLRAAEPRAASTSWRRASTGSASGTPRWAAQREATSRGAGWTAKPPSASGSVLPPPAGTNSPRGLFPKGCSSWLFKRVSAAAARRASPAPPPRKVGQGQEGVAAPGHVYLRLLPRPPDDPHPQRRRGHGRLRRPPPPRQGDRAAPSSSTRASPPSTRRGSCSSPST